MQEFLFEWVMHILWTFHRVTLSSIKKQYVEENKKRNKGHAAAHENDADRNEGSSCLSQAEAKG